MRESPRPYDETTPPDPPVYIVMDSNFLIAEDLCGFFRRQDLAA